MIHQEPKYEEPTAETRAALDEFREQHDGESLGGVASRVLYEDDRVRVWEMTLAPGEHTDLHRHDHDYLLLIDSGDRVAGVTPKGADTGSFVGVIPKEGNTVRVPKGGTEWAWNVGDEVYHEFLIELLDT